MTRSVPRSLSVAWAILALAACASAPPGPTYDLTGSWSGGVSAEGQPIDGTLEITQTGWDLEAVFSSPMLGLRAEGTGSVTDEGSVTLELLYNLECPGTAVLSGRVEEDATRISGGMDAADCTGSLAGSFSFTRRR